jgi:hypothetical protein
MFGITGIFHFEKQRPMEQNRLKAITDIIRHWDPGGGGVFVEKI